MQWQIIVSYANYQYIFILIVRILLKRFPKLMNIQYNRLDRIIDDISIYPRESTLNIACQRFSP